MARRDQGKQLSLLGEPPARARRTKRPEPAPTSTFASEWVLDRKHWPKDRGGDGRDYCLRRTNCGNCRRCKANPNRPIHGPYWAVLRGSSRGGPRADQRARWDHVALERDEDGEVLYHDDGTPFGPWHRDVPPSIPRSDDDPNSRRSLRRAAAEVARAARAKARAKKVAAARRGRPADEAAEKRARRRKVPAAG